MKNFFRKIFGVNRRALKRQKALDKQWRDLDTMLVNLAVATKKFKSEMPERDEFGRWITGSDKKTDGCCGGETCKCKKKN